MFMYLKCPNCGQRIKVEIGSTANGTLYLVECGNCEANMQCIIEDGRRLKVIETVTI